jgi:hypothetical protein
MNSSVLKAIATPSMLTANGLMAYSSIIAGGNGMKDWNMRKEGVQPHHAVVGMIGKPENMVVVQPELADDDEADKPAERFDSVEPQLPLPETIQEAHDLRPLTLWSETCATNTMQFQRASQKRLRAQPARLQQDN